jgi:hypothetical protein
VHDNKGVALDRLLKGQREADVLAGVFFMIPWLRDRLIAGDCKLDHRAELSKMAGFESRMAQSTVLGGC